MCEVFVFLCMLLPEVLVCFSIFSFLAIPGILDQGINGGKETTCDWSSGGNGG